MDWQPLTSEQQVRDIQENISHTTNCVIFKHSTTCSLSAIAKHRMKDLTAASPKGFLFFYLDLLSFRPVSNFISETFGVVHESPQILVIKDGKCIYNESHLSINIDGVLNQIEPMNG